MSRADELADRLASGWPALEDVNEAVRELRRLSAVNAELLRALKEAHDLLKRAPPATLNMWVGKDKIAWGKQAKEAVTRSGAAIQKAEEA